MRQRFVGPQGEDLGGSGSQAGWADAMLRFFQTKPALALALVVALLFLLRWLLLPLAESLAQLSRRRANRDLRAAPRGLHRLRGRGLLRRRDARQPAGRGHP